MYNSYYGAQQPNGNGSGSGSYLSASTGPSGSRLLPAPSPALSQSQNAPTSYGQQNQQQQPFLQPSSSLSQSQSQLQPFNQAGLGAGSGTGMGTMNTLNGPVRANQLQGGWYPQQAQQQQAQQQQQVQQAQQAQAQAQQAQQQSQSQQQQGSSPSPSPSSSSLPPSQLLHLSLLSSLKNTLDEVLLKDQELIGGGAGGGAGGVDVMCGVAGAAGGGGGGYGVGGYGGGYGGGMGMGMGGGFSTTSLYTPPLPLLPSLQLDPSSLSNSAGQGQGQGQGFGDPLGAFVQVGRVGVPEGVLKGLEGQAKQSAKMGLLSEIGRVWIILGSYVLIWDYNNPEQGVNHPGETHRDAVVSIDHQGGSEVHSVALVKTASPNNHLLVIAGNNRVELVGLQTSSSSRSLSFEAVTPNAMTLSIQTPYQIVFSQIVSTSPTSSSTGNRIFLRDQGGSLWEFVYDISRVGGAGWLSTIGLGGGAGQPSLKNWTTAFEGYGNYIPWGSKRSGELKQILVDSDRSILYGLTRDNKLQRWSLGANGALTPKGNALNVLLEAGKGTMGHGMFDASKGVQVVRMDLVEQREASVSLVLTTSNGARIYFKDPGQPTYGPAPTTLYPCHVRLPPHANQNNPIPTTSKLVTDSRYLHGVHITIHEEIRHDKMSSRPVSDTMWYTPDLYEWAGIASRPQQQPFQGYPEVASLINLDTQILDIGEEQSFWNNRPVAIKNLQRDQYRNMAPTMRDTHEFITETTVPEKRKIVVLTDKAVLVLEKVRPIDQVEHLLTSGQAKADVMIAIQRSLSTAPHALLAIDLEIAAQNSTNGNGNGIRVKDYLPGPSAQAALDHFVGWSQDLEKQKKMYENSGAESSQSRQNALSLQLARMLRTVGYTRILASDPATNSIFSAIPVSTLQSIQSQLEGLKTLLNGRTDIFSTLDRGFRGEVTAISATADGYAAPRLLLEDMIQAIAFVILMSEFRLAGVIPRCGPGLQQSLFNMTYYSLVTEERSRDAAKRLVTAVVDLQISQEQSIELISDKLQDRCPSFCSKADVELYKAMESLRKAKEVPAGPERSARLDMALNNFVEAAPGLSEEKVREVCGDFCSLNFAAGCIVLPTQKAEREDPEHLAYGYWIDGSSPSDARKAAFDKRKKYYNFAFMALSKFDADTAEAGPSSASAATKRLAYEYALGSSDDLFLMCLYEWYIQQGRAEEILKLDNDSKVQGFLLRRGPTSGHPDLLWRFFALKGKHAAAAEALYHLAHSDVDIPFPQRVEALTSALMQAKSAGITDSERVSVDFITTLEAETEVASVQLEVWKALADSDRLPTLGEELRRRLCQTLLDVTEMYQEYAVPYGLHECRLVILQTADHRDYEETMTVWEDLFKQTSEESATRSEETRYQPWRDLVVRLGKRFYPSPAAFPTSAITEALFGKGIEMSHCPEGWVTKALEDAGVSYQDIWAGLKAEGELDDRGDQSDAHKTEYIDREISLLLPRWIEANKKGKAPPFFPGVTDYLGVRLGKLNPQSEIAGVFRRASEEIGKVLRDSRAF